MNIVHIVPEEFDEALSPLIEQAEQLQKKIDLYVTRDKSLSAIAVNDDNEVIGAIYLTDGFDEFDFDVLVSEHHREKGAGKILMSIAMERFDEALDINPDLHTSIRVLHPAVRKTLYRHGFVPDKLDIGDLDDIQMKHTVMSQAEKVNLVNTLNKTTLEHVARHIRPINHLLPFGQMSKAIADVMAEREVSENTLKALTHYALSHKREYWPRELLLEAIGRQDNNVQLPSDLSHLLENAHNNDPEALFDVFSEAAQIREKQSDETLPLVGHVQSLQTSVYHFLKHGGIAASEGDVVLMQGVIDKLALPEKEKKQAQDLLALNVHAINIPPITPKKPEKVADESPEHQKVSNGVAAPAR